MPDSVIRSGQGHDPCQVPPAKEPRKIPIASTPAAEHLTSSDAVLVRSEMSPEQVLGKPLDTAPTALFWVVLYETATESDRSTATRRGHLFDAILDKPPAPAVRSNPGPPKVLDDIIDKALQKDGESSISTPRK